MERPACDYYSGYCRCEFGALNIGGENSEGKSGCPEIRMAIRAIEALPDKKLEEMFKEELVSRENRVKEYKIKIDKNINTCFNCKAEYKFEKIEVKK